MIKRQKSIIYFRILFCDLFHQFKIYLKTNLQSKFCDFYLNIIKLSRRIMKQVFLNQANIYFGWKCESLFDCCVLICLRFVEMLFVVSIFNSSFCRQVWKNNKGCFQILNQYFYFDIFVLVSLIGCYENQISWYDFYLFFLDLFFDFFCKQLGRKVYWFKN